MIYSQSSLKQPSVQWTVIKFCLFTVNLTSVIKHMQSPFRIPNWLILLYFTSLKRSIITM